MRKRAGPGCRAAARDRQAVTCAAEAMLALNEAMVRRRNPVGEFDQAKQIVGIDRVVAGRVSDAFCQILEIDAWARGAFQFLGNCIEILYGKRARERLVD